MWVESQHGGGWGGWQSQAPEDSHDVAYPWCGTEQSPQDPVVTGSAIGGTSIVARMPPPPIVTATNPSRLSCTQPPFPPIPLGTLPPATGFTAMLEPGSWQPPGLGAGERCPTVIPGH